MLLVAWCCHIKSILSWTGACALLCQYIVLLTTAILLLSPLGTHGQNIGNAQLQLPPEVPSVSEPPEVGPEITGIPMEVRSGEWLKVQCHLPWMNVKPTLEFFVNGKGVKHMVSGR